MTNLDTDSEEAVGISSQKLSLKEVRVIRQLVRHNSAQLFEEINKLLDILKSTPKDGQTEIFMTNALTIIGVFVSKDVSEDHESDKPTRTKYKKAISQLWAEVMKWDQKSQFIHRKILRLLPEKVMGCLSNPLHTSDFLMSAFDFGGPIALYSLKGIFVLMTRYNMEVPDFYTRLYSLLQPEILEPRYQADFFENLDIFLMSTHLPEQMVAAFVKKLARMSLTAPSPSLLLIFAFIQNLMVRHPGLVTMVNTKFSNRTIAGDPFLPDEKEPINTRAMESCLWEIKTLQNHPLSSIAMRACFINKAIGKQEVDWTEFLQWDYDKLSQTELINVDDLKTATPSLTFSNSDMKDSFYEFSLKDEEAS